MFTPEMLASVKKVEATRQERLGMEPRRMTAEEKDALLKAYHPDYREDGFDTIKIGPNKGEKVPKELGHLLHSNSRLLHHPIDLTKIDYDTDVLIIGGGISAVGGMVYITTIAGCVWNHEGLSGVGWLAVALVIFCLWRPLSAIWGSVLFGALMILYLRLTIPFIPTQLYKILPYVVTLVVLIIVSLRKKREDQPPTSLGLNYFREDR